MKGYLEFRRKMATTKFQAQNNIIYPAYVYVAIGIIRLP